VDVALGRVDWCAVCCLYYSAAFDFMTIYGVEQSIILAMALGSLTGFSLACILYGLRV